MLRDDLLDRIGKLTITHGRIDDQQIGCLGTQERVQLRLFSRRVEGVGFPQHYAEMSEKVSRKECYDVQCGGA